MRRCFLQRLQEFPGAMRGKPRNGLRSMSGPMILIINDGRLCDAEAVRARKYCSKLIIRFARGETRRCRSAR